MIRQLMCGVALLAGATPVYAQTVPLWGNLHVGMTKAEVKATLPKKTIAFADGCSMVMIPRYDGGKLSRVDADFNTTISDARCGTMARDALKARYGQAETSKVPQTEYCFPETTGMESIGCNGAANPILEQFWIVDHWVRDGVSITYYLDEDKPGRWRAIYKPDRPLTNATVDKF